jgi:glycine betaine/choline ABC-type transport system substrate-binding protein
VRGEDARKLNLKTVSEAARYSPQWQAGFGHDFISRQDGYPGFSRAYGLRFRAISEMALDLTYTALSSRQVDMIAGNSTDGRIASLDLAQLEDDRRYFPPYEAVFMTRKDSLGRVPLLADILQKLGGAISTEEMRKLNYEVDGARRDKKVVIREWLLKRGFVK